MVEVNEAKTKVEAIQVGFDEGIGRIAKANKAMQEVRKAVESSASSVGGHDGGTGGLGFGGDKPLQG